MRTGIIYPSGLQDAHKRTLVCQYNAAMRFAGQTAVVTGAGRGMGKAIALALAAEGAAVVVAEVDAALGAAVVEEIRAGGGRALAVTVDISDEDRKSVV